MLKERPSSARATAAGLGTGLAGLFQPLILILFGLLALGIAAGAVCRREARRTAFVILAGLLVLLAIVPWTVRNYEAHHRLVLIKDSFGKEFWMGNNPHATGTAFVEGGGEEVTNAFPPKAFVLRGKVSEIELMDAMGREGLDYCRAEPKAFIERTLKKIGWFWTLTRSAMSEAAWEARH